MTTYRRRTIRSSGAAVLVAAGLGLAGCSAGAPDADPGVEDTEDAQDGGLAAPYVGPYDESFLGAVDTYTDEEVTLSAEVGEIVAPVAFTVVGGDGSTVPPLLVVHDPQEATVEQGETVEVIGTLREAYNAPSVEEDPGAAPADDVLAAYDGQPYIDATVVNSATPSASASAG